MMNNTYIPPDINDLPTFFRETASRFEFYSKLFEQTQQSLSNPAGLIDRMRSLRESDLYALRAEFLERHALSHFLVDRTTGTTGDPKIRVATAFDDAAEARLSTRFFRGTRIRPNDHVVALDIDSADIYVFYADVLADIHITAFTYLSVDSDNLSTLRDLASLSPTVLIATPTLLYRTFLLRDSYLVDNVLSKLRSIIYIGEAMDPALRRYFESREITLFSFFGTTEIGSCAGECIAHNGLHIYNDSVIPTLINPTRHGSLYHGEVAWTTCHFRDFPLIKYLSQDTALIANDPCPCGLSYPRIMDIRRTQDEIVLYGHKFSHQAFAASATKIISYPLYFRVEVLHEDSIVVFRFIIDEIPNVNIYDIVHAITSTDEIAYFIELGLVRVECLWSPMQGRVRKNRRMLYLN